MCLKVNAVEPLTVGDASKVKVYGPGLTSGTVNKPADFTIDTREAGPGGLGLTIGQGVSHGAGGGQKGQSSGGRLGQDWGFAGHRATVFAGLSEFTLYILEIFGNLIEVRYSGES